MHVRGGTAGGGTGLETRQDVSPLLGHEGLVMGAGLRLGVGLTAGRPGRVGVVAAVAACCGAGG